ncbi:metalloregulator ArsR/SmtB family transcription factor [Corynebacterium macginleyi]|uniref:metalloregulator ArsR/SmtB family transcription factor n=1 Tax=Corynebacterium macginleyi TaxID=38290 RepID=UPI001909A6EC|nr:helix-turn-helix transcriptional regulator [Corynebacterium macginleyi]
MTIVHLAFNISAAASIIAALDSPLRISIITRLAERDHYVHELVKATGKSQPLISQHLRVLKQVGIVSSERNGREVTYSLVAPEVLNLLEDAAKISS